MYRNLSAEIARKGLGSADAARVLQISVNTFNLKISGKKVFTMEEAIKLAKMLGGELSIDYLFQGVCGLKA